MLKYFICEDRPRDRDVVLKAIKNVVMIENYTMILGMVTDSPHELIKYLENHTTSTGIYFLDYDLRNTMTGIELAEKIREYDPRGFIIMVTAMPEAMPLVFKYKIEAMDFIDKSDFSKLVNDVEKNVRIAYDRYNKKSEENYKVLSIKQGDNMTYVDFDQIISIETVLDRTTHKLILTGPERKILFWGYLKHIIKKLDERFFYLSQSYIVNLHHVTDLDKAARDITMSNGTRFIIPMKKMQQIRKLLSDL